MALVVPRENKDARTERLEKLLTLEQEGPIEPLLLDEILSTDFEDILPTGAGIDISDAHIVQDKLAYFFGADTLDELVSARYSLDNETYQLLLDCYVDDMIENLVGVEEKEAHIIIDHVSPQSLSKEALDILIEKNMDQLNDLTPQEKLRQQFKLYQQIENSAEHNDLTTELQSLAEQVRSDLVNRFSGQFEVKKEEIKQVRTHKKERLLGKGGMGQVNESDSGLAIKQKFSSAMIEGKFPPGSVLYDPDSTKKLAQAIKSSHGAIMKVEANLTGNIDEVFEVTELLKNARELYQLPQIRYLHTNPENNEQKRAVILQVLSIFADALRALSHLHRNGLVHRDLKPANILLATEENDQGQKIDRVKIIDLETTCESGYQDYKGRIVGTPFYMGPEQFQPMEMPTGISSDIYAIGKTLYDMLGGEHKKIDIMDIYRSLLVEKKDRTMNLSPEALDIDQELVDIIKKCTDLNPKNRPDINELIIEIEKLMADYRRQNLPQVDASQLLQQAQIAAGDDSSAGNQKTANLKIDSQSNSKSEKTRVLDYSLEDTVVLTEDDIIEMADADNEEEPSINEPVSSSDQGTVNLKAKNLKRPRSY